MEISNTIVVVQVTVYDHLILGIIGAWESVEILERTEEVRPHQTFGTEKIELSLYWWTGEKCFYISPREIRKRKNFPPKNTSLN